MHTRGFLANARKDPSTTTLYKRRALRSLTRLELVKILRIDLPLLLTLLTYLSRIKSHGPSFYSLRYIESRYAIVAKNSHRFITIRTHQRKPTYPPTHPTPLFSNAFIALPPPLLPCQGPRYKTIDRAERRKCVCIYGRETSLPINIPKSGLTTVPHRLHSEPAEIPRRTADPCHVAIVGDGFRGKKGRGEGREGGISAGPHGLIAPVDLSAAKRRKGRDGWKCQNAR